MILVANQKIKGFLTKGKHYPLVGESKSTFAVVNDKGNVWYYYKYRFDTLPETIQTNQTLKHTNGKTYEVKEVDGVVSLVEFVEPPIIGEVCLFSDLENSFENNYGKVGVLTKIEYGKFYSGSSSWCYCKTIKSIK